MYKGDIVHFAIPNNTEYHSMAIGVWLCEGVNSCADPGSYVAVLNSQFEDTKAKIVICYEGSRKRVYETLSQNGNLGKTQVIILEKACPNENDDLPIVEEGFKKVPPWENGILQNGRTRKRSSRHVH